MKRIGLLSIIIVLLLGGGCTDVWDEIGDTPLNKDGSIAFRTDAILTRGTPQEDLTAYNKLNLIAYSHRNHYADGKKLYRQAELSKVETGVWDYTPHMFWPDERNLSFLAYAIESNIAYATASGKEGVYIKERSDTESPIIEYMVPTTVEYQPDLIIATVLDPIKPANNNIKLPMKHALSCVSFCATSPDPSSKVKSITLKEVYRRGALALDSEKIEWTELSDKGVTAFNPGIKNNESLQKDPSANYNYLMKDDGFLMMIPQKLTNAAIDVVYWKETEGTEQTITYTLPTKIEWQPGLKYIYSFDEVALEGVVTYYEKYSNNNERGVYYYNNGTLVNTLKDEGALGANNAIIDAGYGLLVPNAVYTNNGDVLSMGVGANALKPTQKCDGSIWAEDVLFNGVKMDCVLYPMTQDNYPFNRTKAQDVGGIQPTYTNAPTAIKAQFSPSLPIKTHGYCLPHYARGVYTDASANPSIHYIRTPIQMRNISYQTNRTVDDNITSGKIYVQEFTSMDYQGVAGSTIRGNDVGTMGDFTKSIVYGKFNGTFDGKKTYSSGDRGTNAIIKNLKINTKNDPADWKAEELIFEASYYIALFEWVDFAAKISNLTNIYCQVSQIYANTSVNTAMYVGLNNGGILDNLINNAPISNVATYKASGTGGIVAYSGSTAGGEVRNCINMAAITGTVYVGGIAGYNNYKGKVVNCNNGSVVEKPTISSTFIRYENNYPVPRVGGIVGLQQCGNPPGYPVTTPEISGCINYGNVEAPNNSNYNRYYVGGIVGENDWNWNANEPLTAATAYGEVLECTNYGDVSGFGSIEQGVGGIAGANNGFVRRSQSSGKITASGAATAGGIVGYNTNVVHDCLYYNNAQTTPISGAGYVGGIVGQNTSYNSEQAYGSAYVNRCIYLARSPVVTRSDLGTVTGYAPIAGHISGYLIKDKNGTANLTVGKVPYYTVENCFFLSGTGYNDLGETIQGLYEPVPDNIIYPFKYGRYPMGINRLTTADFATMPFMSFWSQNGWKRSVDNNFPYITQDNIINQSVSQGSGQYLPMEIVTKIRERNTNTAATIQLGDRVISGNIRVELFNIDAEYLGNLTSISVTFGTLTFSALPPNDSTYAGLFIKAPQGWNITSSLTVYGNSTTGYYVFLTQEQVVASITMQKIDAR